MGHRGTFDPLFPSSHDKYGLTDLFGSSNIVYFRPGVQYTIRKGLAVAAARRVRTWAGKAMCRRRGR